MTLSTLKADPIIIAHRGASGYAPEHTLAAKAMAHAMGAQYIEQDVVLTKDGVPVVLHDHTLDKVTNVAEIFPGRARDDGRYYAIDFTLAEIKTLRAHERIDLKTGKRVYPSRHPISNVSHQVSTLEEEILFIQGLNKATGREAGIYPEIKAPAFHRAEGQDISRIVLDVLKKHGYTGKDDRIYLQCFDWNETQRIRRELGYECKLVQLIAENQWLESPDVDFDFLRTKEGITAIAEVADGIGPWIPHVVGKATDTSEPEVTDLVALAHGAGLQVHPYTLRTDQLPNWARDHDHAMAVLFDDAKVDGIFSDFPDQSVDFFQAE